MQNATPSELVRYNYVPLLVVILMLGSYYIGSLKTKADILEKRLTDNPSAVLVANDNLPTNNAEITPQQAPPAQKATKKPELTADDYIRGNKNAKITLVEYSDLECPFCKRFHPTMQQVMKEYGDKVKWVYRHYPLSFHANAQKEAEATECAGKLGGNEAFWKYVDAILDQTTSNGTGFAQDKLVPLAKKLGLNEAKFKTCLDTNEFAKKVKDQITSGTDEGVTGTPGTIIIDNKGDTQLIPGALPFEQIKPMIDSALNQI